MTEYTLPTYDEKIAHLQVVRERAVEARQREGEIRGWFRNRAMQRRAKEVFAGLAKQKASDAVRMTVLVMPDTPADQIDKNFGPIVTGRWADLVKRTFVEAFCDPEKADEQVELDAAEAARDTGDGRP